MRGALVAATAALVLAAVLGVLWIGTAHRDHCLQARMVGCSLVPWSGKPAAAQPRDLFDRFASR